MAIALGFCFSLMILVLLLMDALGVGSGGPSVGDMMDSASKPVIVFLFTV